MPTKKKSASKAPKTPAASPRAAVEKTSHAVATPEWVYNEITRVRDLLVTQGLGAVPKEFIDDTKFKTDRVTVGLVIALGMKALEKSLKKAA